MSDKNSALQDLHEIRSLMERSSKFLSLSGLSGVSAGVIGLLGGFWANMEVNAYQNPPRGTLKTLPELESKILMIAGVILVLALGAAFFFSRRLARKREQPIWNKTARLMLLHMMIPLVVGGIFGLIQLHYDVYAWIAGTTLIFYGLALLQASYYTLPEIKLLAFSELILGLLSCYFIGYGLLFWMLGFGALHILYGGLMYFKYER